MYRQKDILKAVALALLLKERRASSTIVNYTHKKLAAIVGISEPTARKRMKTLSELGLVKRMGKNNDCVTFVRLHSHSSQKNINATIDYTNIKTVESSLAAMLVVIILRRKEYVRRCLHARSNGQSYGEVKDAARRCKVSGLSGSYKEYGLSYAGIASKIGCSISTAFKTVAFAIKSGLIRKKNVIKQVYLKDVGFFNKRADFLVNYTFITANNVYKVYANQYSVINYAW